VNIENKIIERRNLKYKLKIYYFILKRG